MSDPKASGYRIWSTPFVFRAGPTATGFELSPITSGEDLERGDSGQLVSFRGDSATCVFPGQ